MGMHPEEDAHHHACFANHVLFLFAAMRNVPILFYFCLSGAAHQWNRWPVACTTIVQMMMKAVFPFSLYFTLRLSTSGGVLLILFCFNSVFPSLSLSLCHKEVHPNKISLSFALFSLVHCDCQFKIMPAGIVVMLLSTLHVWATMKFDVKIRLYLSSQSASCAFSG